MEDVICHKFNMSEVRTRQLRTGDDIIEATCSSREVLTLSGPYLGGCVEESLPHLRYTRIQRLLYGMSS